MIPETAQDKKSPRPAQRLAAVVLGLAILGIAAAAAVFPVSLARGYAILAAWATLALSLYLEGLAFLFLGVFFSALTEFYLSREWLRRFIPRAPLPAALAGVLLGLSFPAAGAGAAPLARRLARLGAPVPTVGAFLLAAGALNPITLLSGLAGGAAGTLFWSWLGTVFTAAALSAAVLGLHPQAESTLAAGVESAAQPEADSEDVRRGGRFRLALRAAADELVDFGVYLLAGCGLAALAQMLVPQTALAPAGHAPLAVMLGAAVWGTIFSPGIVGGAAAIRGLAGVFPAGGLLVLHSASTSLALQNLPLALRVFRLRYAAYLAILFLGLILLAGVSLAALGAR
jgi:uncharacterized membrane protein YraQ (UPF0718 family)